MPKQEAMQLQSLVPSFTLGVPQGSMVDMHQATRASPKDVSQSKRRIGLRGASCAKLKSTHTGSHSGTKVIAMRLGASTASDLIVPFVVAK